MYLARYEPPPNQFDVAVDQALVVGGREAGGDFASDPQDFALIEAFLAVDARLEGLAAEVLHGDERDVAIFADLVDRDDVVVLDGGGGLGLAQEAVLGGRAGGDGGLHGLEGDLPFELGVLGPEDDAHAADAHDFEHAVVAQATDLVGLLGGGRGSRFLRLGRRRGPVALFAHPSLHWRSQWHPMFDRHPTCDLRLLPLV